nr:putative ribonuclease H-like domain-containing protein [Tanacetum cinerariifolium]
MIGYDNHDVNHHEISNPSPPIPPPTQQIPYIVSSIKLPILKRGEYDIWAMKMEHYLSHTYYLIWQINDDDDMEEIDLKWQVPMISMRIKKFHKRTCRKLQFDTKDPVGFDKTKVECFNCHKMEHFSRDCRAKGNQDSKRRDVSNLSSENKVKSCSKTCEESYAKLKKLYDEKRDKLSDASVEITAYTSTLKKVEAQLVCHQQNQLAYEQNIRFIKIDLDDKTDVLAYHKKLLAEALKEKEDLKTKFENWNNSSKNLSRLLNTKMSVNDKFRLGYGDYRYGSILSYENEVLQSVFMNKESDLENSSANDGYVKGMHADPPLMTRNYIPSRPDVEIDYSKFTYGPKQTSADESNSKPSEYASCESDSSTDAPIIEEYDSDSDNDSVSNVQEDIEKPSFAFTDSVKHVKTSREDVKETGTPNHSPKIGKQCRDGHTRKGLSYAFTRKACFVCGSFIHLIRDCDFHEKRMAKQAKLVKSKNKDDPHKALKDKGIINSRCSRHMIGNKAHLADYQEFKGGFVTFRGSNGRITENQANKSIVPKEANNSAGTQANDDQSANTEEIDLYKDHFVLPIWSAYLTTVKSSGEKLEKNTDFKTCEKPDSHVDQIFLQELEKLKRKEKKANDAARKETTHENQNAHTNNTNLLNVVSTPISTAGPLRALHDGEPSYPDDPSMPHLEDIYATSKEGILLIHPMMMKTRSKVNKNSEAHALKAIETKWVYRNKKDERGVIVRNKTRLVSQRHRQEEGIDYDEDERGVIVRNKTRLVSQRHRQEEGIDYDEVFAPMARIEAIRIFLAFASYMGFIVYQMDVKSTFLYSIINEEVYVTQPPCFVDPKFPNKVYKVVKALYGLHQAPKAWYATLSTFLEKSRYRRGAIHKTLFIKQDKKDIMLLQVYVDDIIFGSTKKSWCDEYKKLMKNRFQMSSMGELTFFLRLQTASTPIETQKPLVKDEEAADVDVTLKTSRLQAMKRIFRYIKGQPKLGRWYLKVSSFDLEAYSDSDYVGANLDRKTTIGGCQFLGRRLISWQ